jgi:hypothetical protein
LEAGCDRSVSFFYLRLAGRYCRVYFGMWWRWLVAVNCIIANADGDSDTWVNPDA